MPELSLFAQAVMSAAEFQQGVGGQGGRVHAEFLESNGVDLHEMNALTAALLQRADQDGVPLAAVVVDTVMAGFIVGVNYEALRISLLPE